MAGIDQQIEQRKMQFRGNPQALQQRYGQSKQLLDLLALQQIATEQKQKAQAMQMQMQQNPATVAQQVEQEVLQGKKAEMAQALGGMQAMRAPKRGQTETARGVAGALAQRQREKQSRMQRMADSGVASQPARNMERMYDGGIVGFDAGGYTSEELERFREGLARRPGYETRAADLSEAELARLLAKEPGFLSVMGKKLGALIPDPDPTEIVERYPGRARRILGEDVYAGEKARQIIDAIPEGRGSTDINELIEQVAAGEIVPPATIDDPPTTTAPTTAAAAPTEPGLMERKAQQKQELSQAGADILGSPAFGPLEARRSVGVPDLLRAREGSPATAAPAEPKQLTRQEQLYNMLMENVRKQGEALTTAEEDLKSKYSGRSRGQKILDRLITAAQMQAQGAPARTNRQALARLLGGYTVASGQERKAEEEGLARLAERRKGITEGQLGLATGLAQIERGEALTEQGARGLGIEEQRVRLAERQIDNAVQQFYDRLGLDYAKMGIDDQKAGRIAEIQKESNRITEEFNRARTEGAKKKLAADYAKMIVQLNTTTQEAVRDAIKELEFSTLSETEKTAEIARIREAAETELRRQQEVLRRMQKAATGQDMGEFSPTTGAAVSGSGIKVLGVE